MDGDGIPNELDPDFGELVVGSIFDTTLLMEFPFKSRPRAKARRRTMTMTKTMMTTMMTIEDFAGGWTRMSDRPCFCIFESR